MTPKFNFNSKKMDANTGAALFLIQADKVSSNWFFNATDFSRAWQKWYGETVDWHEFSYLLDGLATLGLVLVDHIDSAGRVCYRKP